MNDTCTDATTSGAPGVENLTLDTLLELLKKVDVMPTVVRAFYFIDRAKEYFELLSFLKSVPGSSEVDILSGPANLSVFNVRAREITDDWPPVKEPGVWAVMSDGSHREMMRGETVGELAE